MLWVIAVLLAVAWSIGMVLHKGGFIHILLLCAIALIVVQLVAGRRAVG
ncbi:MAG TPA: lmo0937 family membrane protein [Pyrinomonadaceae bacterium]|nr:lmo0937 family membrane protein [Pyrinomonadaceae bacterium]